MFGSGEEFVKEEFVEEEWGVSFGELKFEFWLVGFEV